MIFERDFDARLPTDTDVRRLTCFGDSPTSNMFFFPFLISQRRWRSGHLRSSQDTWKNHKVYPAELSHASTPPRFFVRVCLHILSLDY